MSQNYSCPVCGRRGLPQGCARCPQCDADLTCFQVLDVLAEPLAAKPAAKGRRRPLAVLILLAAALLAVLAWGMSSRVKELDDQQLKTAEGQVPGRQQEQPAAPASSAAAISANNTQEDSAVSPGGIRIDAEVKEEDGPSGLTKPSAETAVAGQQNEAPTSGKENTNGAPAAAGGQQVKQEPQATSDSRVMEEALTATEAAEPSATLPPAEVGETEKAGEETVVAGSPPVDEAQPTTAEAQSATKPPSEEAAGMGEKMAASPANLPVLKATPKRRVRTPQPASPAALAEHQPENTDAGSRPRRQARASSAKMFLYQAQDGETLQDIAERFYGDQRYYPVILDQNPYLISSVNSGNWMRLFADPSQAAAVYESRTVEQDGLLLWRYEVRPGETWRTIYARFFPPRYSGRVFYEKNPRIIPGSTVLIILR